MSVRNHPQQAEFVILQDENTTSDGTYYLARNAENQAYDVRGATVNATVTAALAKTGTGTICIKEGDYDSDYQAELSTTAMIEQDYAGRKTIFGNLAETNQLFTLSAGALDTLHGIRNGAMRIDLIRSDSGISGLTGGHDWDGNPDTALYVHSRNYDSNVKSNGSTAAGGLRAAMFNGRNDGAKFSYIKSVMIGGYNKSGKTLLDMTGLEITLENYGTLSSSLRGIKVDLRDEGVKATTEYGIEITNSGVYASYADAAIKISRGSSVNTGFSYGIDMSDTNAPIATAAFKFSDDDVVASNDKETSTESGSIAVKVGSTMKYIALYSASPS